MAGVGNLFDLATPAAKLGEELNTQQRAAVRHGEGPLLVVAGAGTGKTRVITERIRHLLETNPELPGESILALTFTDRASGEMKHRVIRACGERGRGVFVGTFHAFCNALLVGRNPKLQALDDVDHWILLRRHLSVLALEPYRLLAPAVQFLGDFLKFFSRCPHLILTPVHCEHHSELLPRPYPPESPPRSQ